MTTKSLTEIANHYATDKGTIGPSARWNAHNYTDVYEAYLEKYRFDPLNFLEVGLGVTGEHWRSDIVHGKNSGGASIRMWYDYFEKANIFGIDINECAYLDNDRIKTYVADQGDTASLDAAMKKMGVEELDFVIDDGSHRPDHQQITFSYFFKKLKPGGLYFIEDLLSNGYGDGKSGRMASNEVRNTRSIFRHYLETGKFLEPHGLMDTGYLEKHMDYMRFHVPRFGTKYVLGRSLRHPFGKVMYYKPNTERVCVIRKK